MSVNATMEMMTMMMAIFQMIFDAFLNLNIWYDKVIWLARTKRKREGL